MAELFWSAVSNCGEVFGIDREARFLRLRFANRICNLLRGAFCQPVRAAAGEQLVQNHSQRVDIARGRHRLTVDLLRAGIVRSHRPKSGHGGV